MRLKQSGNQNNCTLRVLLRASVLIVVLPVTQVVCQPAAMLEKAFAEIRSIKSLSCSILRKQSYKGIGKTAQCSFFYDRQKGRFAYVYVSPYEYSFWADDSMVCGVQRGKKRGYIVKAAADSVGFRALLESVHVCGPLFQGEKNDVGRVSLKASIDDFLYFERSDGIGREVVKIDRNKKAVMLIETFDSAGALRRQTLFEYDSAKVRNAWFPKRVITRANPTGKIETDTLLFSKVEINKGIKESVFVVPAFTDIGRGR